MNDLNNPDRPPPTTGRNRLSPTTFGVAAVIAVLILGGAYTLTKLSKIDSRLSQVDQGLTRTVDLVKQLSDKTEETARQARQAEENSRLAAEGRSRAETALAEAERVVEGARGEAEAAKQETQKIRQERDEELNRLQSSLNRIAETRRTALGLVMNLGSDALQFDFNKAELRPGNRELLSRIVGILLTLDKGYAVYVYGHTDDVGSEEYNLELSKRRAESVRDYLVDGGINPSIITTEGFGKTRPLVSGSSPEARAKNRRVEIGIIHTDIRYSGTAPSQ